MPQMKMRVSEQGEPMEREADAVAARVTSGSAPGGAMALSSTQGGPAQRAESEEEVQRATDGDVQRATDEEVQRSTDEDVQRTTDEEVQRTTDEEAQRSTDEDVQRKGGVAGRGRGGNGGPSHAPSHAPGVTHRTASTIAHPGGGTPMPRSVRSSIEPHLGANLSGVRVHSGSNASHAATSLGARAFTVGNNIFLNRSESPFDVSLMAHESTHVVQQGNAPHRVSPISRSPDEVQLLPDFITDKLAGYARHVPGYTLFTYIIEYDPLRGSSVQRSAMTLVEGLMGLVPAGTFVFDQLKELNVLQPAFDFIEAQLATFDLSLERLERTIDEAWDEMDFIRLDPFDHNIGVLRRHAGRLLDDVRGFASSILSKLMELIKEALISVAEDLLSENKAWDLIKKILHYDPLRGEEVEATTVEILEDFLMLIGREQELEQMRVRGTLQTTADWLDTQVATFFGLLTELSSLFSAAWDALQPANLVDLPTTLPALALRAGAFLQRVWDFATTVATEVIQLIKDALLGWLASFVDEVPGFHLLTVILQRNPFTGEAVPRTAVNIIRGFITLLPGGNDIYAKLAETGVIGEAGARIEGALSDLGISWEFIVGLFTGIWETIVSIDTLIDPIGVFIRIRDQFGEPVSRLFAFIRVVLRTMFELLLAMMNFPSDLIGRIIDNAMQAFEQIKADPVGFLINMLAAVKLGFSHFFDNILDHLSAGLVDWLFRGLRSAGIEPPEDLSFESILDTVLQVLDISVERVWEKLADRFGQETIDRIRGAIDRVVGIWTLVRDISERGISALWEYVQDQLSNLWDTVMQAATDWIMETIVNRVIAKMLSMLDPTGIMAVINGFIAFFNAIQSAIEYLRDILEIIDSYVATFAAVAAGDVEPGAARLEGGLGAAIPVALGFLANQVGLGNIGEKIAEIIGKVRGVVDQALDWLLDKLEGMVNSVLAMIGGESPADEENPETDVPSGDIIAVDEDVTVEGTGHSIENVDGSAELVMRSRPRPLVQHPDQAVRDAYQAYLVVARQPELPNRRVLVNAEVDRVLAAVQAAGIDPANPGFSAPGIGEVERHGVQQSRLYNGPVAVWRLRSEHIAAQSILSQYLREIFGPREGLSTAEYEHHHTILTYVGASKLKDFDARAGDLATIRRLRAGLPREHSDRTLDLVDQMALNAAAPRGTTADDVRDEWEQILDTVIEESVGVTMGGIGGEAAVNGALRGETGDVPSRSAVSGAAADQRRDVMQQFEVRLADLDTS